MIDWLTIIIALVIIASLIGGFGFLAWKISMSDPLTGDGNDDSVNEKRKKEKNSNEQSKKKRKDQKKSKRENKDEHEKQQQKKTKPLQTSEETDDEREESEQELLNAPVQTVETSSKARKRNKNKTRSATPPPPPQNDNHTKNQVAARAPLVTHPKSAPQDELESTKQQTKVQTSNKQTLPTPVTNKKSTQNVQKQQQQEQPFTVVGNNRHKNTTSTVQQNKPQVNPTPSVAPVQQSSTAPVQHEQLAQRQQLPPKETPTPVAVPPVKQAPPKLADLVKVLPSSQVVVTELMSALDAFPLSPDELDVIMHKIANKQSVVKQDWNKLQQGQKVDPQAHIGQVLDESAKAYEDDLKHNSVKRIKELTAELNAEKHRNNVLLKEKTDKEREIQMLHAQLDSTHHKVESSSSKSNPQQKLQALELQLQRVTEDNILLTQQLAQQTTSNLTNTNDAGNMKVQVLSEQIKKLSVDNANFEKKAHSNELLAKEAVKEKEDLIRYNEQLTQSLQKAEKDLKLVEEKHHKQLNEIRTSNLNDVNEYKNRIQQLENDNEQLKREEIVHVEPSTTTDIQTITINNEEREQLENEIQQLKQTIELNQQKQNEQHDSKLNKLQVELNDAKSTISRSEERLRQQRQVLTDLLSQDLRQKLPNDNQDSDQWLSSYRQLSESHKQNLHEEFETLKRENVQLHKNMTEIENQLKEIESTVQSKEETLLNELKNKDVIVEKFRNENDQLKNELQHLQSIHQTSVNEARALKLQLDAANSPSIVAADESFELVKQISPSQSPIVIDMRAEQLNELIRSSKEALENQDSATQQLDQHLNDIHRSGLGETSTVPNQQS